MITNKDINKTIKLNWIMQRILLEIMENRVYELETCIKIGTKEGVVYENEICLHERKENETDDSYYGRVAMKLEEQFNETIKLLISPELSNPKTRFIQSSAYLAAFSPDAVQHVWADIRRKHYRDTNKNGKTFYDLTGGD